MNAVIGLLFLGLSFGVGPCLLSCGPLVVSYFVASGKSYLRGLGGYLVFCLGRVSVYIILSSSIFFFGKFTAQRFLAGASGYINILGGLFIIILGIVILLRPYPGLRFCTFLEKHLVARDKKSLFVMGLVIGLLPCGPLLAMLAYVAVISRQWFDNLLYTSVFGIGTALSPLLVFSFFAGRISSLLDQRWRRLFLWINAACSIIMIFLGIELILRARY